MEKNVGFADSFIRLILAILFVLLAITGQLHGTWLLVGLLLAAIFLVTGLVSWCPIWRTFGIRTRRS